MKGSSVEHLTDVVVTPCGRVERLSPNHHQNLKQSDKHGIAQHWCLASIEIANLSKFVKTRSEHGGIWLHTNLNFKLLKLQEEKRFWQSVFEFGIFCPQFLISLLTIMAKIMRKSTFSHFSSRENDFQVVKSVF